MLWWYFFVFFIRFYNICYDVLVVVCVFIFDSIFIVLGSSNGDLRVWDVKYGYGKVLIYILDCYDFGVISCDFFLYIKVKDYGISGCVIYELVIFG